MGSSVILPIPGQPDTGPDPGFKSGSVPALVSFNFTGLTPPSSLYINRDDNLIVKIVSSHAGITPFLQGRMLLALGPFKGQPDDNTDGIDERQRYGYVQPFQSQFNPTTNRASNDFSIALAEGYLLGVTASVPQGQAVRRGECWMAVGMQRGPNAPNNYRTFQLVADYVASNMDVGWPGGRVVTSLDGIGFTNVQTVANPAAGADWSITVPTGAKWRLQSWSATLTTSATVANRAVRNIVSSGGATLFSGSPNQTIPASQIAQVTAFNGITAPAANLVDVNVANPGVLYVRAGDVIGPSTLNIAAADQWSGIRVTVEEWLEP